MNFKVTLRIKRSSLFFCSCGFIKHLKFRYTNASVALSSPCSAGDGREVRKFDIHRISRSIGKREQILVVPSHWVRIIIAIDEIACRRRWLWETWPILRVGWRDTSPICQWHCWNSSSILRITVAKNYLDSWCYEFCEGCCVEICRVCIFEDSVVACCSD